MKVLYDHQIFSIQKFGGINRYFIELMRIREVGIEVDSINPDIFKKESFFQKKHNLIYRGSRYLKRKIGVAEKEKYHLPKEVSRILLEGDFDIFHPTYYNPYFLELTDKPFVLTVYDMIHEIYREYFSLDDRTSYNKRLLCKKADKIIAISQRTKEDLVNIFNICEEKVCVIPLASDFDKLTPSEPSSFVQLEKYILFVGNRWTYKNFYFLVTTLVDILKSDKHLSLLCTGNPFSNAELQFFKDLDILDQVYHIYLENDSELAWTYKHAALFIFPSLYEGFGFPLLEAFASKCPVISSNGGSLPEVGGRAALYFDPKNSKQIREAATTALYDSNVRDYLVMEGEKQFKKFKWNDCREKTAHIYQETIVKRQIF